MTGNVNDLRRESFVDDWFGGTALKTDMQVTSSWKPSVANLAALPVTSNAAGDLRQTVNTGNIYRWSGSAWVKFVTVGGGQIIFDAVVAAADGDYTTVGAAVAAGKTSIFVRDGVYAESTINVTINNTNIIGESRDWTILRFPFGNDGLKISGANGTLTYNLTLDAQTNSAEAAYVVNDGSTIGVPLTSKGCHNVLRGCRVLGSPTIFAVYLSGASYSAGAQTLAYFDADDLQTGNVVEQCELYSTWNGDSFSFSLQGLGAFRNNYCEGRVAFYMQRGSDCSGNTIYNSGNHGIFVAWPTYDCTINSNIIDTPASNGIRTQNQLEHPVTYPAYSTKGCTFNDNVIRNSGDSAFALTESSDIVVNGNVITNPVDHGIYLQQVANFSVTNNSIRNPRYGATARGSGIYLVLDVKDGVISGNVIERESTAVNLMHTGISNREGGDCTRIVCSNNVIRGRSSERTLWVQSNGWAITGNSIEGGNYAGLRLDGASECTVTGNQFRNNTNDANNAYAEIWLQNSASRNLIIGNATISDAANKAQYGISVDGAGCDGNKVGYNTANGAVTGLILDTGTSTEKLSATNSGDETEAGIIAKIGTAWKIKNTYLPDITITDTSVVASQAAMLALTAQTGDVAVRTDLNKTFILKGTNSTILADWQELLTPTDSVTSVNGQSGAVTIKTAMATFRYFFQNSGRTYSLPDNTVPSTFRFENTDAPGSLEFYVGTPTEGWFHFVDNRANNLSVAVRPAALGTLLYTVASGEFLYVYENEGAWMFVKLQDSVAYAALSGATFTGDVIVPDEIYDATAWNGDMSVPTKNSLRDKFESLSTGSTAPFLFPGINQGILVPGLLDSTTVSESRTLTNFKVRADSVPVGYIQNTSVTGAADKNFGNTAGQERTVILFQNAAIQTFVDITVRLKKVGSPTDGIRMRLWDNATVGSGAGTAAVAYLPASALTTSYVDVTFRVATGVSIAAATNRYVSFLRWNGSTETAVDAVNYYAMETTTTMNASTALYFQTNSDANAGTLDGTNEARCTINGALTFNVLKNDTAGTITNSVFVNDFEPSLTELTTATNGRYLKSWTAIDGTVVDSDSLDIRAYGAPTLSATNVFSSIK